ncbi:hypothetical protein [Metabacillus elymi]|uniref:Uncharacterized protein n=1 Tax=Metabacillus elymi TaxID=2745198 RepID=A0ABX6S6B5_9BACI|nr:hypothetical protein [Metabacillus sp. KUDC1714]QNF29640.1 hypothetical protein HUW50_20385 [Metabacillus sp. KUDC1714]
MKLGLNKVQFNKRKNTNNHKEYYVFVDVRSQGSLNVDFVNKSNLIEKYMFANLTMMINDAIKVRF